MTENGVMLSTSEGYPVMDNAGTEIYFDFTLDKLVVSETGEIAYRDEDGITVPTGQSIGIYKFSNVQGLEALGGNLYKNNSATGSPLLNEEYGEASLIRQGYLEASNVQIVE